MTHTQTFPFRPKPKERPRLGKRNRVFTPIKTLEFEDQIRDEYDGPHFVGAVHVDVVFDTDEFTVTITEIDKRRPKHVRADLDNLQKSVLDGLQSKKLQSGLWVTGAFDNDSMVLALSSAVAERKEDNQT